MGPVRDIIPTVEVEDEKWIRLPNGMYMLEEDLDAVIRALWNVCYLHLDDVNGGKS